MERGINKQTMERRKKITGQFIRRIAKHKIEAYGLDCTIDEYIERCIANNAVK